MDKILIPHEGDRVVITCDYANAKRGMMGTVKQYDPKGYSCAVEFDRLFTGGHDCEGVCEKGRGLWVHISCLEAIKPVRGFKFVIDDNGNKTIAHLYINKKIVGTAELHHLAGCTYTMEDIVSAATEAVLKDKKRNEANAIKVGDLVEVTEGVHGTPIPSGARGHVMERYNEKSWLIDFHECYGVTPWEIPESKIRKIDPYETNMQKNTK